jgi:hypothetical protein
MRTSIVLSSWVSFLAGACFYGYVSPEVAAATALFAIVAGIPIACALRQDEAQGRLLREVLAAERGQVTLWVEYHTYFDSWADCHVENRAALYVRLNGAPAKALARAWANVVKLTEIEPARLDYGTLRVSELVQKLAKAGFAVRDPHAAPANDAHRKNISGQIA